MLPLLRTCLPLAIVTALCLPALPVDAQQPRQTAAQPAPPPKPKHGPTPPPIACPKRLAGVDAGQMESFGFWLRAQGPAELVKIDFSCKLDRNRLIVGLVHSPADTEKGGPPKHNVHLLDLSLDPPPARLLRNHQLETPVVIVRPGGGMSLIFGESGTDRSVGFRAYRAMDIASSKVHTLFSLPIEPTGLGCLAARAMNLDRLFGTVEIALVDLGENGPYGVAIDHEDTDCKAARSERRTDTFIAVPDGLEEFK
jgi:hypothetical protein